MATLRAHEADLERQRAALEQDKAEMEAALHQATEAATTRERDLKADVTRLEAASQASSASLERQREVTDGVKGRLETDLGAAESAADDESDSDFSLHEQVID